MHVTGRLTVMNASLDQMEDYSVESSSLILKKTLIWARVNQFKLAEYYFKSVLSLISSRDTRVCRLAVRVPYKNRRSYKKQNKKKTIHVRIFKHSMKLATELIFSCMTQLAYFIVYYFSYLELSTYVVLKLTFTVMYSQPRNFTAHKIWDKAEYLPQRYNVAYSIRIYSHYQYMWTTLWSSGLLTTVTGCSEIGTFSEFPLCVNFCGWLHTFFV